MRLLVTGGAGFIGSHLVERLLAEGHEIAVVDNLVSGSRDNLPQHPRLTFRLSDAADLQTLDYSDSFDGMVHLAGVPSVQQSWMSPDLAHKTNLSLTLQMITLCSRLEIPRLVFASSAAVYGQVTSLPISEDQPTVPQSPYGVQKLASEHYGRIFASNTGLTFVALRLFNVYGPRQNPSSLYSGVISKFMGAYFRDQPIKIYGDGSQRRDFVYVKDVAIAFSAALTEPLTGRWLVCNIGMGQPTSILSLQRKMAAFFPLWSGNLVFEHSPPGDIRDSQADIALATQHLGYTPKFSVNEGLSELFSHSRCLSF